MQGHGKCAGLFNGLKNLSVSRIYAVAFGRSGQIGGSLGQTEIAFRRAQEQTPIPVLFYPIFDF